MGKMTSKSVRVAVASRSFSKHPVLREELLKRYSRVTFNETGKSLGGAELVEFLRGNDRAITALERIDDGVLSGLPELRVISKYGVGLDMIDLGALERRGILLGWTGGVNRRSVAELALAFALAMVRGLLQSNRDALAGRWVQTHGRQLTGKTVGIVGCGSVGQDFVRLLAPFECRVLAHDIRDYPEFYLELGVTAVGAERLLAESDLVSLHLPLDASTRNWLSAERLRAMKAGAYLMNTARGQIVDEASLKEALVSGRLAGAAFDVFGAEPPADLELLRLPNFLATPHIGGSSVEAVLAMGRSAIENLDRARSAGELRAELTA